MHIINFKKICKKSGFHENAHIIWNSEYMLYLQEP